MPSTRIKLIVQTEQGFKCSDEQGQTCAIDTSKNDFADVLKQISTQIGFSVDTLLHIVRKDDGSVRLPAIKTVDVFDAWDEVLAIGSKEQPYQQQIDASRSTTSNCNLQRKQAVASRKRPSKRSPAGPKYTVGTKVKKLFGKYGWFEGEIKKVDIENRLYEVVYCDGDEEDYFFSDVDAQIDQIVRQAADCAELPRTQAA